MHYTAPMKTYLLRVILLSLCVLASTAATETAFTTVSYPITHGDPEAMEEIAKAIVEDNGHVVLDRAGSRLIAVTDAATHARLSELTEAPTSATGNVRIHVRFKERGRGEQRGAGVTTMGEITRNGGRFHIQPDLTYTVTEHTSNTQQSLLTASGREASLRIGERVPHVEWLMDYGWHGRYITQRVSWQEVGAFLVVTPTILADGRTVHIRLTPELRGLVDGSPYRTRFTGLDTEVFVHDGETLSIGGLDRDNEFYTRFLIGFDRTGQQTALDITLRPEIVSAGGATAQ